MDQEDLVANPQPITADFLMDIRDVSRAVKLQKSAIHNRISDGTFPSGHLLSKRCRRWKASEINAWLVAL